VIERALHECPQESDVFHYQARILEELNQPKAALQQEAEAIQLDELDSNHLQLYA
jgi:hypothetical protein